MRKITTLATALLVTAGAAAQTDFGEDFNGAWGSAADLDTPPVADQVIRTPTLDADNQSLGSWTGYTPGDDNSLYFNNSTGFGADGGSAFRATTASVASGFLVFGGTASDETGAYAYTAFPSTPIDLSNEARIQFDATITDLDQAPSAINLRLMLRVPNSPPPPSVAWIISEPFSLAGVDTTASIFIKPANWASPRLSGPADLAAVSIQPNTLSWQAFSVPDSQLVPLSASPEQPGIPVGGVIPSFIVDSAILPSVTGVGLYLDTDISTPSGFGGIWIDALHLRDTTSVPVELSVFTSE